jgi:hypothetical protein
MLFSGTTNQDFPFYTHTEEYNPFGEDGLVLNHIPALLIEIPDGKWFVFRADMHGASHVYAVEVERR